MSKIKELTDFYMWMQENDYDHNIRERVEKKAEVYLNSINKTRISEGKVEIEKIYLLIKDWFHSKTGVSLMHDPSLISLVNEIEALVLLHVSKSLPIKKYEIDFGGHLLAGLEITNNEPTVIGAMNGWGDGISNDEITITEK